MEEKCPFCEMVKEVLFAIESSRDWQDKFDILHSVIDQAKDFGYKDGYTDALMGQIESMEGLIDDILVDDCDCSECKN